MQKNGLFGVSEKRNLLLAVTRLEVCNSCFKISDENKSFSISKPAYRVPEGARHLNERPEEIKKLKNQNNNVEYIKQLRNKVFNRKK